MIAELTSHLWQSTVFAVAAGLLTLAFRGNRAPVRFSLWLSASLKFLVPLSMLIGFGSHLGWRPAAPGTAAADVSFVVERIAQPLSFVSAGTPPVNWISIALALVWASGFLAIAAMRLRSWLRIRAVVRASRPLEIPSAVEIRSSPGLLEPGVIGLLRPVILVPEGIVESLTPSQLEAVLAHELCHVRRRDNLFALLHMIVEAVFWFHPLVWWIGARLVEERERACDEGVLSLGSEPRIYADAIVIVCRLYVESPLVCVSGVTGASIKERIEAIMANRTVQGLNRAKKLLLACAGVLALAGPIAIGVVIGAGHVPAVRAQAAPNQDRRMLALLFDFSAMNPDDQSHARQTAIDFVRNTMKPADSVAIMAASNGKATVAQDFTENRAALESAIAGLSARDGSGADLRLAAIESAAARLSVLPEKKALVYISSGLGGNNQAAVQNTIETLKKANVAIYPIDARGLTSLQIAQNGVGGRSMSPPDEHNRRLAYAGANFKSAAMARTYTAYGPPDATDDRGSSQIWRYNYLANFHSSVEFEFAGNSPAGARINFPPPLVYEGDGRRASFQTYPAGEQQTLSVPLDSLSGKVDIQAQIKTRDTGQTAGAVRDFTQGQAGAYKANFILPAGSYLCSLTVKEDATGRTFGETINFEVK